MIDLKEYITPELIIDLFDDGNGIFCDTILSASDENLELDWFRPEEEDE